MVTVPYVPLPRLSHWLGYFFRRRQKPAVTTKKRRSDLRPLISVLWFLISVLCSLSSCLPPIRPPDSPPGLPFARTETSEQQRALQQRWKAEPNLPRHSGLVFRSSGAEPER